MNIKFKIAKKEDIPKLLEYFEENDDIEGQFIQRRLEYYIDNHFIVLAKDKDKIVGKLLFQAKENPNLGVGEFETVNIHPDYRRRGIGKKLIEKAVAHSKEYFTNKGFKLRCLYVFTRSNNDVAQHIYGKSGFKSENTIGKIFIDNEPEEIIMTRFF